MEKNVKQVSSINEIEDLNVGLNTFNKERNLLKKQVLIFELAKKFFSIDLMDVKEILDSFKIRKLPNSNIYIEGLLNLRGEIIPVINLQKRLDLENITVEDLSKTLDQISEEKSTQKKVEQGLNKSEDSKNEENEIKVFNEINKYGFNQNINNSSEDLIKKEDIKEDSKNSEQKENELKNNFDRTIVVCSMKEGLGGIIVDRIVKVTYLDENQYEEAPKLLRFIGDKFIKGFVKIDNQIIVTLDIDSLFFIS